MKYGAQFVLHILFVFVPIAPANSLPETGRVPVGGGGG